MFDIVPKHGLKTVSEHSLDRYRQLAAYGYSWIAFQAQNDSSTRDYFLQAARDAGLSPGVWGVSYASSNFYRDGYLLGKQAVKLGAEHLTGDIEFAAKDTKASRGLRPFIQGVRDGGWQHPINLNTMGPPATPEFNDYAIDLQSIFETGGAVLTQAYANETDLFTPKAAVTYWSRLLPLEDLNLTISLYPAEADKQYPGRRLTGAQYVELLKAAGWNKGISIFMAEAMTDDDMRALKEITIAPPPPPQPPDVDTVMNRRVALDRLQESVDYWESIGLTDQTISRQRQTLAWRVLAMPQTKAYMAELDDVLDSMNAPRP